MHANGSSADIYLILIADCICYSGFESHLFAVLSLKIKQICQLNWDVYFKVLNVALCGDACQNHISLKF